MLVPVIAADGHTYERLAATAYSVTSDWQEAATYTICLQSGS